MPPPAAVISVKENDMRICSFPIALAACAVMAAAGCSSEKSHPPQIPAGSGEFELSQVIGGGWDTRYVLPGDFDGDGDLDLFLANYGEQNRLLVGNGAGEFTDGTGLETQCSTGLPAAEDLSSFAASADVDGDGDLDILVANNGQNTLLINDGQGRFTDGTDPFYNLSTGLPQVVDDTRALAFANVDQTHGDLDMDVIVVNNGQNKLLLNDGHGEFLDGTDLAQTFTSGLPVDNDTGACILVMDIDSDSDTDFMVGNIGGPDRIYLNSPTRISVSPEVWEDGWGEFKETTFDTASNAISFPYYTDSTHDIKAANLDQDAGGNLDLVLACEGSSRVLLNGGSGFFQDAQADWKRERAFVNGNLHALAHAMGHLYAPGVTGQVSHTADQFSWAPAGGVTGADLLCAAGIPATIHAFTAGRSGVVLQNYGTGTFAPMNQALTTADLRGCAAFAANDAYFVGDGGVILRWSGSTPAFSFENRFSTGTFSRVHGGGSGDVTVVGHNDAVLNYDGIRWNTQATNLAVPGTLLGVYHEAAADKFAVGSGGLILRYYNGAGGLKWYQESSSPTTYTLNSVSGRSATDVWAVGNTDLIKNDFNICRFNGVSWSFSSMQALKNLRIGSPVGTYTVGETVLGSLSAATATVLRWDAASRLLLVSMQGGTFGVSPADTIQGQTSGASGTLAYMNLAVPLARNLNGVHVDQSTGEAFICGEYGMLLHYDGSSAWSAQTIMDLTLGTVSGTYQAGETVSASVSGASGTAVSWDSVNGILTVNAIHGTFDSAAPDIVTGGTSAASGTLTLSAPAYTSSIRGIAGTSGTDCYAVGTGPLVLRYAGAGAWTDVTPPALTADLNSVWVQGTDLYAVGAGGAIVHCDTSTMTWNLSIASPVGENLLSVWGPSASDLFACGENGTIVHYKGSAWYVESTGALNAISASSSGDLWAVGDSGWILHGNGAGQWLPETGLASSQDLLAVHAISSGDVIAVGRAGTVVRYGGATWSLSNPVAVDLCAVYAVDSNNIFACGDDGTVIYWNGSAWSQYYRTGTEAKLTGIWASSIANVWAVGEYATCIHYSGTPSTKGFDSANSADSRTVAVVDVDVDGYQDLVFGNIGQNTLWMNAGLANPGRFGLDAGGRLPADSDDTLCLAKGNFNAAWPYQLVAGNSLGQSRLYLRNTSTGKYEDKTDPAGTMPQGLPASRICSEAELGDVDGDGDIDAVVAVSNGQNRLYINSGGCFSDGTSNPPYTQLPADTADTRGVALADLDRNGYPDIVFANMGSQNSVYLNTGGGVFSDATVTPFFPVDSDPSADVAAGDLNNDQYPDIVFANDGAQNKVYLFSTSTSAYVDSTALVFPVVTAASRRVYLVDVDNDTDLDVLFCNYGSQNFLYLNQLSLTGQFLDVTVSNMPVDTGNTTGAALGDFNGDGYADIVFTNFGQQNRLLINNGTGLFTDRTDISVHLTKGLPAASYDSTAVSAGDFDRDGDLDIVVVNRAQQNRMFLNDGAGLFSDGTDEFKLKPYGLPPALRYANHVAAGDFEGDGDLDLFIASDGPCDLLVNR